MRDFLKLCRRIALGVPGGEFLIKAVLESLARRHKRASMALLKERGLSVCGRVTTVLERAELVHFADFGTLLGLIRENGLLEHDTDIDFGLAPEADFRQAVVTLINAGFKLTHGYAINNQIEEASFTIEGISVDLFRTHLIGEALGHYVFVSVYDDRTGNLLKVYAHERRRSQFLGCEVRSFGKNATRISVPINAEELLAASYGNWRVPDKDGDYSSVKNPSQYREIEDGCMLLNGDDIGKRLEIG